MARSASRRRAVVLLGFAAALILRLILAPAAEDPVGDETDAPRELLPAGDLVESSGIRIRMPEGWRRAKELETPSRLFHFVGDGRGLSAFDEKGGPLQIGLSVERFPNDKSVEARIEALKREVKVAPQRTVIGDVETAEVKLDGDRKGTMLYAIFDKDGRRKSFYEILIVPHPQSGTCVVTGWIVASRDSTLPRRGSVLEKRLAAFVQSIDYVRQMHD